LRFSATYHDAWISYPERLGLELLLDTQRLAPDSVAINYAKIAADGAGFVLSDGPTGERLLVTGKAVVNATGAWLDEAVAQLAGGETKIGPLVSGTKGSHLILDCPRLHDALGGHMVFFENSDGRVCIVFPYLGMVLAGSTDIRVERAARVRCEPEERDYILDALRIVFPGIALSAENVVFSFSGIRPLPRSEHEFTGRIPRGHFVSRLDGSIPQFCMVGGKWTTFRAFAEQAADVVLGYLGRKRMRDTLKLPIGGGAGFPKTASDLAHDLAERHRIGPERAGYLVDAYGTRADQVLQFCLTREDDTPLDQACQITVAEIVFLLRHEFVVELSDILLRRTALAIRGEVSTALIRRIVEIAATELRWSGDHAMQKAEAFIEELEQYHGVSKRMLEQRTRDRSLTCAYAPRPA
jgi:glycerol-3-phosphate dehydrogenase